VLEIPLPSETGAEARVDVTAAVSAPPELQRQRVMARHGMTAAQFEHLLARQLPDAERVAKADYVVDSGLSLQDMHDEIDRLIESLKMKDGRVMEQLRAR
jgi:dephospho-CoA kinase